MIWGGLGVVLGAAFFQIVKVSFYSSLPKFCFLFYSFKSGMCVGFLYHVSGICWR